MIERVTLLTKYLLLFFVILLVLFSNYPAKKRKEFINASHRMERYLFGWNKNNR